MTLSQVTPFTEYADDKMQLRYSHVMSGRYETWEQIADRVVFYVVTMNDRVNSRIGNTTKSAMVEAIRDRKFIPGGRILSQAGRTYHQTDNCYCLRAEDTREGWANLAQKCTMMFMSGGGIGVDYSAIRPYGTLLKRSGGIASGPLPLIQMINSIASASRAGGERRGACYAGLNWKHADITDFIRMKVDSESLKHTNTSVMFNNEWQQCLSAPSGMFPTHDIFFDTLKHACQYGDPGFQFDSDNQTLRNACTEIISADDSDSCCIGSVNLANIKDLSELRYVVNLAVLFLLCNTLYTQCPTDKVVVVKDKNRRLGLGLMGVAEWFIQRQQPYGCVSYDQGINYSQSIESWLHTYEQESIGAAVEYANTLSITIPVATRAIAPTGTISIVGGHTTPGIEPVFHTVYKRTSNTLKNKHYNDGYKTETVIDPIVQKWMEQGYDVKDIDTAYTLSQSIEGIERRIKFQAYVQQFVDNGISSTVNLPPYVQGIEEKIGPVLLKYLPQLRGITFYPDGRHNNQPVVPVDLADVHVESANIEEHQSCNSGECGL